MKKSNSYTAFQDNEILGKGLIEEVAMKLKKAWDKTPEANYLVFENASGSTIDFDLSGTVEDVHRRIQIYIPREEELRSHGPGRPKLGVVTREISLLPHHWEWLALQSGGASATLRRLVEEAKKSNSGIDEIRKAQDATYKFMSVIAGNLPGYEEALRALYAKKDNDFKNHISKWPRDVRAHALKLAKSAFS